MGSCKTFFSSWWDREGMKERIEVVFFRCGEKELKPQPTFRKIFVRTMLQEASDRGKRFFTSHTGV